MLLENRVRGGLPVNTKLFLYSDNFIWPHNSYTDVDSDKNKFKCSYVCIDCSLHRISIRSKQLSLWGDFFILRLQRAEEAAVKLNTFEAAAEI